MPKQLNIIISDEEFHALTELRKNHPDLPSVHWMARALFRYALSQDSIKKAALRYKGKGSAPHQ